MDQPARLFGERTGDGRVGVAEHVDGDAADHVDELAAVRRRGPTPRARSIVSGWRAYVFMRSRLARSPMSVVARIGAPLMSVTTGGEHGAHALGGEQLEEQRVGDAPVDDVSRIGAVEGAERRTDLGDHAAAMTPSTISRLAPAESSSLSSAPSRSWTPSTSVRRISLVALSATASSAATVSALTLYASPS